MLVNDAFKMTSLLTLHQPFVRGVLIKRYKRFLCDIQLESKEIVTAHCPNPGRMTSCYEPGWDVRCSFFTNTKRKLIYGLDLIYNGDVWIGVNTQLANRIVYNAIKKDVILSELNDDYLQTEVGYGNGSRIDFFHDDGLKKTFVEVKSVTYLDGQIGYFPDSVSVRATKHLKELSNLSLQGHRAIVLYCVQRSDISSVQSAAHVDLKYATELEHAIDQGVEVHSLFVHYDEHQAYYNGHIRAF